jgi:hypothetical protein
MKMTKFAPDPALAVAIFGSAAFDDPAVIDSDNPAGDDDEDAELQQPFELFFDAARLQALHLCKSDEPAKTSSLAKAAAVSTKFGIARTEERLIDNTRWIVAFDADGNLVDQQELEPGPLGKGASAGWDDEFVPSTTSPSSNDLHKRAKDPKVARVEKTVYPSGSCVVAELDENNVCIRTYRVEA